MSKPHIPKTDGSYWLCTACSKGQVHLELTAHMSGNDFGPDGYDYYSLESLEEEAFVCCDACGNREPLTCPRRKPDHEPQILVVAIGFAL